jgi:hypothetical protein
LNYETPIIIVDNAKTKPHPPSTRKNGHSHVWPLKVFPESIFKDLNDAQRVDFSILDRHRKNGVDEDPLSDAYLTMIHRKPERQERTLRNTDKGRAQHEKDQVIRLLEGLQGHDWLKLMGVSGITDSRKKDYEPARAYFTKGCEVILDKFRTWREEEKRRKLAKEQALAEAEVEEEEELEEEADEDEEDEEEEEGEGEEEEEEEGGGEEEEEEEEEEEDNSDGDPPDFSDVDASAARQLHEEAIARSTSHVAARKTEKRPKPTRPPVEVLEKDFTSFFAKPYLRAAALGKHRRSGRSVAAWGHAVPELTEREFNLPEEYREEDILKARARKKRRDRRISKD